MLTLNLQTPQRNSSAISDINASVKNAWVFVTFKNGNSYLYSKVSRRAILALKTMSTVSLGFWVNKHCIHADNVITTRVTW